jgi:hypothetical protein
MISIVWCLLQQQPWQKAGLAFFQPPQSRDHQYWPITII